MALEPDVELELLADEHAQAVRRVEGLERAPSEGRVADWEEFAHTLRSARQRVQELAAELRVARAEMDDVVTTQTYLHPTRRDLADALAEIDKGWRAR